MSAIHRRKSSDGLSSRVDREKQSTDRRRRDSGRERNSRDKDREKLERGRHDKKRDEVHLKNSSSVPISQVPVVGTSSPPDPLLEQRKKQEKMRERLMAWKKTVKPELSGLFQDDEPKKAKLAFLDDALQDKEGYVFVPQQCDTGEEGVGIDEDFLDDDEKFAIRREKEDRERKKRESLMIQKQKAERNLFDSKSDEMELDVAKEGGGTSQTQNLNSTARITVETTTNGTLHSNPDDPLVEDPNTPEQGETSNVEIQVVEKESTQQGVFAVSSESVSGPTEGQLDLLENSPEGELPPSKTPKVRKRGRKAAGLWAELNFSGDGDPLDQFMASISTEVKELRDQSLKKARKEAEKRGTTPIEDDEQEEDDIVDNSSESSKRLHRKNLEDVDHSLIDYKSFRKEFYIEVPEILKITPEELKRVRKELDGMKVRGKGCPKPIKNFSQCGLSNKILAVLTKHEYMKPTPIQAQALPAVMSGRDVVGVAKTGSGKTLAYLLPLFRHIQDQPPLASGDGPIGLIMAPTRELATQIHNECKKFKKATGIRSVCVYGGAGVQHQIGDLKRGAEIVVCTPGRMIDILCANRGRITNLRRVTMLILDEADRMFDMGFEPQITRIINNIRPDRQTLLFSATFPKAVESHARKILKNPLELTVRGKGVVADTVEQNVEIVEEEKKQEKLLELISTWYELGSILVFVDRQESADQLWREILKSGYQCLVIHGGKDQLDRDFTIKDFKEGKTKILVATSVAARGLDVPNLRLVINFDVPNHLEDYVHRVGRTGRAGNIGTAWTFITSSEGIYARDIYKALTASGRPVSEPLKNLVDDHEKQRKQGLVQKRKSGFNTGSGYKFDEAEEMAKEKAMKLQKIAYGEDEDEEEEEEEKKADVKKSMSQLELALVKQNPELNSAVRDTREMLRHLEGECIQEEALNQILGATGELPVRYAEIREKVKKFTDTIAGGPKRFTEELEINDYPQTARWKVTHKDALASITEMTGCGITAKGQFFAPGRNPPHGIRKLYLFIEGNSREEVRNARIEIKRILDEAALTAHPEKSQYAKYTVI